ncbi:ATP-binding protein [Actinocorallia sp. A-T 12471]|uniref:ATP-binding protein n=1 Tax=Actinocorallia sp. A-T 12471 TaxID=3089813 RepID=UPI0029D3314C|nr:ATP-binding protein [Actinocorallia sp. A-T 12471]MDX6741251.1 ATP-binding protein [Actinocorallia sp. A-T 12471]
MGGVKSVRGVGVPMVFGEHMVTVSAEGSKVAVLPEGEQPPTRLRAITGNLPKAPLLLYGRDGEATALVRAIEAGQTLHVRGGAGVGKSSLLRKAAHLHGGTGLVYLDATGRDTGDLLQDVFEACFDAPGHRPAEAEARKLLADVPVRLIVDDLAPGAVDRLLDAVPSGSVIFSGTARSPLDDEAVLKLEGLDRASALALLRGVLGRDPGDTEAAAAEALWRATAGEPLALLRAAASTVSGELPPPGRVADLVPALIESLDESTSRVLTLLALPGCGAVRPEVLDDLVPLGSSGAERLTRMGLAVETSDGYRVAPGPVAAPNPGASDIRATARVLRAWAGAPDRTPQDVAAHADLIAAVVAAASRTGDPESGGLLAHAACAGAARSLRLGAWGRVLEQGKAAAERAGDRRTLAHLLHEDGVRLLLSGRRAASASALAAAAVLWRELGDPVGAGLTDDAREALRHGASVADLHAEPTPPEPKRQARAEPVRPRPAEPREEPAPAPRRTGGGRARHAVPGSGRRFKLLLAGGLAVAAIAGGYAGVSAASSDTVPVRLTVRSDVVSVTLPGAPACSPGDKGTACTTLLKAEKDEPTPVSVGDRATRGVALRYWGCDEGPAASTCTVTARRDHVVCATTSGPRDAAARQECEALTANNATAQGGPTGLVTLRAPTQWRVEIKGAPVVCRHDTDEIGETDPITGRRRCGEFPLAVGQSVTLTATVSGQIPAKGRYLEDAAIDRTPVWYGCDAGPLAKTCTITMTRERIEAAKGTGSPAAAACVATPSDFDLGARSICSDLTERAPRPTP